MFKLELKHSLSKRDYRGGSVCSSFADIQELILPVYGSLSFEISGKFSPRDKIFAQGGRMPLPLWQCPTKKKPQFQTCMKCKLPVSRQCHTTLPQHTHQAAGWAKPGTDPAGKVNRWIFPEQLHTSGTNAGPRKRMGMPDSGGEKLFPSLLTAAWT